MTTTSSDSVSSSVVSEPAPSSSGRSVSPVGDEPAMRTGRPSRWSANRLVPADIGLDGPTGDTRNVEPPVNGRRRTPQQLGYRRRRPARHVQRHRVLVPCGRWGAGRAPLDPTPDQPTPYRLGAHPIAAGQVPKTQRALPVEVRELPVARPPAVCRPAIATGHAALGETCVHQAGSAAQLLGDLSSAEATIYIQPNDLVVADVLAHRRRARAPRHTRGNQPVVRRLRRHPELRRQRRDRHPRTAPPAPRPSSRHRHTAPTTPRHPDTP